MSAIVGSDELPALAAPQSLVALPPPSMGVEASIATAPVKTKQLSITAPKEIAALQEILALTAPQTTSNKNIISLTTPQKKNYFKTKSEKQ